MFEETQNLTEQVLEQPDLTLRLTLLSARRYDLTFRGHFQPELFNDSSCFINLCFINIFGF